MTTWNMRPLGVQILVMGYRSGEAWNETAYANPEFDKKLAEATAQPDVEKRKVLMKDLEQILQDSGILIQPYWRSLFNHSAPYVKNFGMHPTNEHDFHRVWLDKEA
jgi:peptide/nickel transport system substrate-binding protein